MIRDCPKCGLANPPESQFCDCGYDFLKKKMDRERAPKQDVSLGFFRTYWALHLVIIGICCGVFGGAFLVWELSENAPSLLAIARSLLISVLGFGLVGYALWKSNRSR